MTKDDTKLIDPVDLPAAVGLLTRFPVQLDTERAVARGAASAWAYPLVGVMLGVVAAVLAAVLAGLSVPPGVTAGIVLAFGVIVTGAMHEDGLADSADGLWGGWDKARRLEIMKDSRIGVYGVCALGIGFLIRWSALVVIIGSGAYWAALIVAGALSRAGMVAVMTSLPNARDGGLSKHVGRPPANAMWLAVALGAFAAIVFGVSATIPFALAACVACALIAKAKIGGQTGDILGATQQITEITTLMVIASLVT